MGRSELTVNIAKPISRVHLYPAGLFLARPDNHYSDPTKNKSRAVARPSILK